MNKKLDTSLSQHAEIESSWLNGAVSGLSLHSFVYFSYSTQTFSAF